MARRYTLGEARAMLGIRGRRFGGRVRRYARSHKPSLVDLGSMSFGGVHTVQQMGGVENAVKNPKATLGLMSENYFGYDPNKGAFNWKAAWENQWKPFLITQGGQALLMKTKVGRRLSHWKVPFLNIHLIR